MAKYTINELPTRTPAATDVLELQASGGGASGKTTVANLKGYVSVKDYGAVGDGLTDDTASIQTALSTLLIGGGTLYFPRGVYLTDAIDLRGYKNVTLYGDNEYSEFQYHQTAVIKIRTVANTGIKLADDNAEIPTTLATGIVLHNLAIDGNSLATTAINMCRSVKLINCKVTGAVQDGIVFEGGSYPIHLQHVVSQGNGRDGLLIKPSLTTIYSVKNCEFGYNGRNGVTIYDGSTCVFENVLCQSNTGNGFSVSRLDPSGYTNPIFLERLLFLGCYTESNGGWGFHATSYNTNPASYAGKLEQFSFINCSFNSGISQQAYLRGLSNPVVINSLYLSNALDPLYNTLAIDKLNVDGAIAPKYGVDLTASTSGKIQFPATQISSSDVNALDDYEEGTWTARISSAQTDYFTTSGTTSARYQKVGNVVHCFVRYSWSDKGTADPSYFALVDNLPYPVLGGAYLSGAIGCSIQVAGGSTDHWHIWPYGGTQFAVIIKNNTLSTDGALVSELPAAGTLSAQFSYISTT